MIFDSTAWERAERERIRRLAEAIRAGRITTNMIQIKDVEAVLAALQEAA